MTGTIATTNTTEVQLTGLQNSWYRWLTQTAKAHKSTFTSTSRWVERVLFNQCVCVMAA